MDTIVRAAAVKPEVVSAPGLGWPGDLMTLGDRLVGHRHLGRGRRGRAGRRVILYVGGKAGWFGGDLTEGEGRDSANIDLPAQQVELINAVTAVGTPTVAVVAMGRPQVSPRSSTSCPPW